MDAATTAARRTGAALDMLLWTRDAQRLAFRTLERELALSAVERTPLWLHAKRACRTVDCALLQFFVGVVLASRELRRWLWMALRRVGAARAARFVWLWCEWMAFMVVTDIVARWLLRCIR